MAVITMGCRVNQVESEQIRQLALANGLLAVNLDQNPDLIVINSCTVTAESDRQARQLIRKTIRQHADAHIVVTGCYAQYAPKSIAEIPGVSLVLGNPDKIDFAHYATLLHGPPDSPIRVTPFPSVTPLARGDKLTGEQAGEPIGEPVALQKRPAPSIDPLHPTPSARRTIPVIPLMPATSTVHGSADQSNETENCTKESTSAVPMVDTLEKAEVPESSDDIKKTLILDPEADRARATLLVQSGCDERCTYCRVPAVRGASRSLPKAQILQQARHYIDCGMQELVISGVNLGAYGRDLAPSSYPQHGHHEPGETGGGIKLAHLVEDLLTLPGLKRLRLSSLDPLDIDDDLIALFAGQPALCSHLHLSVQSGDDLILKRMHRRYGRGDILHAVQQLRRVRSDMVLGGDFIVGFPTESDAAFENTLDLVKCARIALLHVFRYSHRPGTAATRIPQKRQIAPETLKNRASQLRQLGHDILQQTLEERIGQQATVLVESMEEGVIHGRSDDQLAIRVKSQRPVAQGRLIGVTIRDLDRDTMQLTATLNEILT